MISANAHVAAAAPAAGPIFSAVLRPHRSLSRRGIAILVGVLLALSTAVGTTFFLLGAWPIPGFLGLDVVAVFLAIRWNNRAARAAEEITITEGELLVRSTAANGKTHATTINPYWARLEIERREPFGIIRMEIASHGRSLPIGAFLGPVERETLAVALMRALAAARASGVP